MPSCRERADWSMAASCHKLAPQEGLPTRMRRFVIVGQRASASPDFSLQDLPSTSGRLDVLLRCVRAALLVSHGLRHDTCIYLVLQGGPMAPRALRLDGATVRFLRPDERSLATLVQKTLAVPPVDAPGFTLQRSGIARAEGGLEAVLADLGPGTPYVLEAGAPDVRTTALSLEAPVFFVGDHLGFDAHTRARLAEYGATPLGLGPVGLHAEDAITVLSNEIDRRAVAR
jgi:tRNA (pseudouridine54-N1)-methyltransferase